MREWVRFTGSEKIRALEITEKPPFALNSNAGKDEPLVYVSFFGKPQKLLLFEFSTNGLCSETHGVVQ